MRPPRLLREMRRDFVSRQAPGKQGCQFEDCLMPSGDVSSPTSLFPQAQAAPTNALAQAMTPLQAVGLANSLTQLQANQQSLAAKQATGDAYAGALNDDGSVDQAKLATALRGNPAAAFSLPETTDRMLSQTGAQTNLD